MLRLVEVTPEDVEVLLQMVSLAETPDKKDLLEGLSQLSSYFRTKDALPVRMVLPANLHKQMMCVIDTPFMPADADRMGLPTSRYLHMITRLPDIRRNFQSPDIVDPKFLSFKDGPINKTYLN